ncbi:hypothetical protein NAH08_09480, partial [Francisella tularensis subsp. holarctica]
MKDSGTPPRPSSFAIRIIFYTLSLVSFLNIGVKANNITAIIIAATKSLKYPDAMLLAGVFLVTAMFELITPPKNPA